MFIDLFIINMYIFNNILKIVNEMKTKLLLIISLVMNSLI